MKGWTLVFNLRLVVLFRHTLRLGVLDCLCGARKKVLVLRLMLLMILLHLLLLSHHRL